MDQASPIDLDAALEQVDGDTELLRDLVDTLLESAEEDIEKIRSGISSGDTEAVQRGAHSLKGAAASLAAEPLCETAFRLETAGRSGNLREAPALLEKLEAELERLKEFVDQLEE